MGCYAVCAKPKIAPAQTMILRRFADRDAAAEHALNANMEHWEDIWVEERQNEIVDPPYTEAPFPWTAEWPDWNAAFTYMRDANGKRVASLFGCRERRQRIAALLEELTANPTTKETA